MKTDLAASKEPQQPPLGSLNVLVQHLSESRPPGTKPFRLGVLFVHGVGEQSRGDTLTEMGDALIQWVKRWVERPAPGQVDGAKGEIRILSASLRELDDDLVSFSNVAMEVRVPEAEGSSRTSNWLMGESWWADVFRPPSFSEFAAWGVSIGQWEAVTQILDISERLRVPAHAPGWLRPPLWVLAVLLLAILVLASIVASTFFILLAAVLTAVRLIPIGFIQQAAVAVQRVLAMGAGDAFILVRSPARFAAMVSRVRDDLRQMGEYCDEVIVVAHSQGAQVAWEAIRRSKPGPEAIPKGLSRLVTFGQALRRLKLLYRVNHLEEFDRIVKGSVIGGMAAQLGLVALVASLADILLNGGRLVYTVLEWLPGTPMAALAWFFAIALAAVVGGEALVLFAGRTYDRNSGDALRGEITHVVDDTAGFDWTDMWASADPISNGSLLPTPPPHVTSWRIHNLGTPILDHTAYWQNMTEFVAAIATDLGKRAFPGSAYFPAEYPHPRLIAASQQRGARVTTLIVLRIAWVGTVLAWTPAALKLVGGAIANAIPNLGNWPIIGGAVDILRPVLPATAGLVVLLVAALLLWRLQTWVWSWGVAADERAYFNPRVEGGMPIVEGLFSPWSFAAMALVLILLLMPFLLLSLGYPVLGMMQLTIVPLVMMAVPIIISGGRRMGDEQEPTEQLIRRSSRIGLLSLFGGGLGVVVAAHYLTPQVVEPLGWVVRTVAAIVLAVAGVIEFWHFRNRYDNYRAQTLFEQESVGQVDG